MDSVSIRSFEDVWGKVYENNQVLQSARENHIAQYYIQDAQTTFSNPEIEFETERVTVNNGGTDSHDIALSGRLKKTFSNWGVYTSEGKLAELDTILSALELSQVKRSVHHSAKKAYGALVIAQKKQILSKQSYALAQEADAISRRRYRVGAGSPIDSMRTGIQLVHAELALHRTNNDLLVATKKLELQWGGVPYARVDSLKSPLTEDTLATWKELNQMLTQSPEWKRVLIDEQRRDEELSLAQASRIPEFELSMGIQKPYEGEGHTISAAIAIPLPVLHLNGAAIAAAEHHKKAAQSNTHFKQSEMTLALKELHMQYQLLGTAFTTTKERLLPVARSAFDGVLRGYVVGKFTGQELLDARSEWLDSEYTMLDITRDYYAVRMEIEYYTRELTEITNTNNTNTINGDSDENP